MTFDAADILASMKPRHFCRGKGRKGEKMGHEYGMLQ